MPRGVPRSSAVQLELLLVPKDPNEGKDLIVEIRAGTGWPGGCPVGRRPVRDVPALRRAAPVEDGGARRPRRVGPRRFQGGRARGPRQGCVRATEARSGRAPRAACPRHRVPGAAPHVDGDGGGHVRGRGDRGRDPARGPADRRLPLERAGRPIGEHHRLGGADRPQADRDQGRGARRSVPSSRTARRRCGTCVPACYQLALDEAQAKEAASRRAQLGTGERAEKIRTYNFPEGRVTDHRIKHTSHQLHDVLTGGEELDEFVERRSVGRARGISSPRTTRTESMRPARGRPSRRRRTLPATAWRPARPTPRR